jgi:hypothetical protein
MCVTKWSLRISFDRQALGEIMSMFQNTWLTFNNLDAALADVQISGDTKRAMKRARTRLRKGEYVRWVTTAHFSLQDDGIVFVTDEKICFCWCVSETFIEYKSYDIGHVTSRIEVYQHQGVNWDGDDFEGYAKKAVRFAFLGMEITLKHDAFETLRSLPFGSSLTEIEVLRDHPEFADASNPEALDQFEAAVARVASDQARRANLAHFVRIWQPDRERIAEWRQAFQEASVRNNNGKPRLGAQLELTHGVLSIPQVNNSKESLESVIVPGSPAARAGLQPGDEIQALNGTLVSDSESLKSLLSSLNFGDEIELTIGRGGSRFDVAVDL